MPCFASSNASVRVSETMPAFVTSYCPMPARVDVGTGQVSFLDNVAVHDCGTLVNLMTLAGHVRHERLDEPCSGQVADQRHGLARPQRQEARPRGVAIRPDKPLHEAQLN